MSGCARTATLYFMQPEASSPTRDDSLRDVIDDLVRDFGDPEGTDARDMAVWRDGRILAVVRKGRDSRPEVIDFTADGAIDTGEERHR